MPKKGINRRKIVDGEITIHDFANSPVPIGRLKKTLKPNLDENENLADDDEIISQNTKSSTTKIKQTEQKEKNYNDYHIDIWFLISEHIRPEDTKRFALICRKTEAVVASARYWLNLYRRFYSSKLILPDKLKPGRMDRVHGVRAKVISSLFFTYPPFALRLVQPPNLTKLENLRCIQTWYKSCNSTWMFCYRFRLPINVRKPLKQYQVDHDCSGEEVDFLSSSNLNIENFLREHSNIFDNAFEGQHLLIISTDRFIPLPNLQNHGTNLVLKLIRQPLAKNMLDTGLEMIFADYRNVNLETIRYESILKYKILNWWDPEFSLFENL